ncbi:MAG: ASCH domain-containing protein [bacterium]
MTTDLRLAEFARPHSDLRRRLVQAILRGEKTSTSSLLSEYGPDDPLPEVGERFVLIDELDQTVGIIEVTEVRVVPLGEVDLPFARDEGEGFTSVAAWRAAHEAFWCEAGAGLPDDTAIVCERFRLVEGRAPTGA